MRERHRELVAGIGDTEQNVAKGIGILAVRPWAVKAIGEPNLKAIRQLVEFYASQSIAFRICNRCLPE